MDIRSSRSSALLRLFNNLSSLPLIAFTSLVIMAVLMPVGISFAMQETTANEDEIVIEMFNQSEYNGDIFRPKRVHIVGHEIDIYHFTYAVYVNELLDELEIAYDIDDRITPLLGDQILTDTEINIVIVESQLENEFIKLPFATTYTTDGSMYTGHTKTVTNGIEGTKRITYILTYEDGELINRQKSAELITKQPITQVVARGTKLSESVSCGYWDNIIDKQTNDLAEQYWLKSVMRCESACNPAVVSRSGNYHGLFQYSISTFYSWGGKEIYDGTDQIGLTLKLIRLGKKSKWPVCGAKATTNMPIF